MGGNKEGDIVQLRFPSVRCGLLGLTLIPLLAACAAEPLPQLRYAERPCYRTLAEVDCHPAPLPGEESRRVDFYDQPIAVERKTPWTGSL